METKSVELTKFYNHFKKNCTVKVIDTAESRTYFHWKRLLFDSLNSDQMLELADYIKETFSTRGLYSHNLPKLHAFDGRLCLTVDVEQINEKIK